ncbi:MAG: M20 family metallopeptidase [Eubacteriales bacterium]
MDINALASEMKNELVRIRRDLHKIPETAYSEFKTNEYIMRYLNSLNADIVSKIAKTGVKAVFYSKNATKTIAIRSDIDALPITENTGLSFASINPDFMHACGHDAHMAMALVTAKIISKIRDMLSCNMVFLFQPAEESTGGAELMIESGALSSPKVDEIYAFHVWPDVPLGKVSIKKGAVMANMCDFDIDIHGKSAHSSKPDIGIDAIEYAAHFIAYCKDIVKKDENAVLNIGKISGGNSRNIISDFVHMEGTLRSFDEDVFNNLRKNIKDKLSSLEKSGHVKTKYLENTFFPAVVNPNGLADKVSALLPKELLFDVEPSMASEDFAYYQKAVPGLYMFLGIGTNDKTLTLHSNDFNFDESVLELGLYIYLHILSEYISG